MKVNPFKSIVHKVTEGQTKTGVAYRKIILKIPGYVDEFGEKKAKDQFYEAVVFHPAIEKVPITVPGDHVLVTAYLNGYQNLTPNSEIYYSTTLSINDLQILNR